MPCSGRSDSAPRPLPFPSPSGSAPAAALVRSFEVRLFPTCCRVRKFLRAASYVPRPAVCFSLLRKTPGEGEEESERFKNDKEGERGKRAPPPPPAACQHYRQSVSAGPARALRGRHAGTCRHSPADRTVLGPQHLRVCFSRTSARKQSIQLAVSAACRVETLR